MTGVDTFTFTALGAGTTTTVTGNLTWLNTGGATYVQTGLVIAVAWANHGFADNAYVQLDFVGGSYAVAGHDTNYLIQSVPDANSFTVTALSSAGTSGGVRARIATAQLAAYTFNFDGEAGLRSRYLTQIASYTFGFDGQAGLTTKQLAQTAPYRFTVDGTGGNLDQITRIQQANYDFNLSGHIRLRVGYPQFADYRFVLDGESPRLQPIVPATKFSLCGVFGFELRCRMDVERGHETVTNALDNAAALLGYNNAIKIQEARRQPFVDALNAVLQLIFSRSGVEGLDYFNQVTRDVTVGTDGEVLLNDDVQSVDAFVRMTDTSRPLHQCERMSDYERFADLYLTPTDDLTIIHAYYLNRSAAPASAFGFSNVLQFTPPPAAPVEVTINVCLNAPRYTWAHYLAETALSLPHRYAQSLLYPLLREKVSTFIEFKRVDQLPLIQQEAAAARLALGIVDPKPSNRTPPAPAAAKS